MDSLEVLRRICALDIPEAKNVPIIAIIANVFQEDVEKCLNSGINYHIGKSLCFNHVIETLRKHLSDSGKENLL